MSPDAVQVIASENNIAIQKIRWLSKQSEEACRPVVVFLGNHRDADALLGAETMNFHRQNGVCIPNHTSDEYLE
jgi:hypothetical protein